MPATTEVFWGEIAPCEHLVEIYEHDAVFLDSLEGFVSGGLRAGDAVVVIAMPGHLYALQQRLTACGIDLDAARREDRYIDLDAQETLDRFMRGGRPDEKLFSALVAELLKRAGKGGRRVRAFGEMVAILWANGHGEATMKLEHLWHALCQKEAFSLFCAYPRAGFQGTDASIREICEAHSRVITSPPGSAPPHVH